MGTFYINQALYGGYLNKPYASFETNSGQAIWFPIKVQKTGNRFGYINVMCYSPRLQDIVREYIISANVGKRLVVQGETIFPIQDSKAVMLLLRDINFVDDFTGRENSPDFSED